MKHIKEMLKVAMLSAVLCVGTMTSAVYAAAPATAKTDIKAEEAKTEEEAVNEEAEEEQEALYTPAEFMNMGIVYFNNYRFSWYSERVLPGSGLNIPGRHTDELGYVCDEDDFICVASRDFEKGTEVDTPFGKKGKVYDWCAISGTIDIYVNW